MPDTVPPPAPAGSPDVQPSPPLMTTSSHDGRVVVASDALLAQLDSLGRLAQNARLSAGALLGVLECLEPRT